MVLHGHALILVVCFLAALSSGCRCTESLHPLPQNPITDPDVVLRALAKPPLLRNLTTFPRVEYYSKRDVRKGTVAMVIEPPDRVRFEALSPSGNMLALLASDGSEIVLYERGSKRCYRGPACARNISRLLPISIEPRQLVRMLLGKAPLIRHSEKSVRFDRRSGHYQLTLRAPGGLRRQEIWVSPDKLLPMRSELYEGQKLRLRLDWRGYRKLGGQDFPRRIDAKIPTGKVDMSIKFRELNANRQLKMKYFRFACPEGTTTSPMSCDAP